MLIEELKNKKDIENLIVLIEKTLKETYTKVLEDKIIDYLLIFNNQEVIKRNLKNKNKYFLIKEKEDFIGYFEINFSKNCCNILNFYVLDDFSNFEVLEKILKEIIKISKNEKSKEIKIYLQEDLKSKIEFFEKSGFKKHPKNANYIGDSVYLVENLLTYTI